MPVDSSQSNVTEDDSRPDAAAKDRTYSHSDEFLGDQHRTASRLTRVGVRREACVEVTNLSDRELSGDQLSLLRKGLGFVPTRGVQATQVLAELREWERLMRLREFWHNNSGGERDRDEANDNRFKKSNWTPPKGRDPCLDLYMY